jgi:hypothetical protein
MHSIERLYRYDRGIVTIGGPRSKAIVLYALKRVLESQGLELDDGIDNKSVWSTEALFERLEEFGRPLRLEVDKHQWAWAYKQTLKAFGCRGQKLSILRSEEDFLDAIKPSKSAGLPTLRRKGEVFKQELKRMQRIKADVCAPPPCLAFHRVQHGDKGPKTRLVWGYPLSMTLLEAQFAKPLIDNFLKIQSPMAFGYRKADLWARIIPLTRAKRVLALDYSRFDSSVHPRLIMMAFSVLATWFTAADRREGRWDKLVHYFIHTPILMPDGFVYRKHQGVPSGSYFTQLVDSIVNYFLLQCLSYGFGGNTTCLVLGDDSLLAFNIEGNFGALRDPRMMMAGVRTALSCLGITMNMEKSHCYEGRGRQAIHFLGHTWSRGYPHRNMRDIARRAVYPERYYHGITTHEVIRQRVLMFLGDAVESWKLFRSYLSPSRHGVCSTAGYGVRGESGGSDIGWYRALEAVGTVVKINHMPFKGLLT